MERKHIQSHEQLEVYQIAFEAAMEIFEMTRRFPKEETYSLTDQIRRSSRSVCANLTEAWRKRRYEAAFLSKLNDAETEAAETQTWLDFAARCGYLDAERHVAQKKKYNQILGKIVMMIIRPEPWLLLRDHRI
ncbi:MAG TPA: four helix bundle protein [Bacteroidota bacterium]|nr:four helix bundle protein [Bacteroidota bacterium]